MADREVVRTLVKIPNQLHVTSDGISSSTVPVDIVGDGTDRICHISGECFPLIVPLWAAGGVPLSGGGLPQLSQLSVT